MPRHTRSKFARIALVATLAAGLILPATSTGQASPVRKFWLHNKDVRKHRWHSHTVRQRWHRRWHRRNPNPTWRQHNWYHHGRLTHRHRESHRRWRATDVQRGGASYYSGRRGACGKPLRGLYAAHRTWPCGTKVSVKRGKRYVIVRVLDRGPYIRGRVIDLSRSAFDRLGSLSSGVMDVRIHRLKRRR